MGDWLNEIMISIPGMMKLVWPWWERVVWSVSVPRGGGSITMRVGRGNNIMTAIYPTGTQAEGIDRWNGGWVEHGRGEREWGWETDTYRQIYDKRQAAWERRRERGEREGERERKRGREGEKERVRWDRPRDCERDWMNESRKGEWSTYRKKKNVY